MKSETQTHLQTFVTHVENQFDTKVKTIQSDNGANFIMFEFCTSKGIIRQTLCVETPQQNGIFKRKHQHILNVTHALLLHSHLPPIVWSFVVTHATFLINCLPTPLLNNLSPYQKLYYKLFDTFSTKKLNPRVDPCIFLGFKPNTKGYVTFYLTT